MEANNEIKVGGALINMNVYKKCAQIQCRGKNEGAQNLPRLRVANEPANPFPLLYSKSNTPLLTPTPPFLRTIWGKKQWTDPTHSISKQHDTVVQREKLIRLPQQPSTVRSDRKTICVQ